MSLTQVIGLALVLAAVIVGAILIWLDRRKLQRDLNSARNQVEHWTAAALKHSLHAKQLEDDFEKAANLLVEHGDFIEWVRNTVEAMAEHVTDPTAPEDATAPVKESVA